MSEDELLSLSAQLQSGRPLSPADTLALVEEVRRLRAAASRIFDADLKHDWRILTNDAAIAFLALQRLLPPAGSPPPACG